MSNKQISKDNRDYWSNKLETKFREKRMDIESLHAEEINQLSIKNFSTFKNKLKLEKTLNKIKKLEENHNDFHNSWEKTLSDKRSKILIEFNNLKKTFTDYAKIRNWNYDFPNFDFDSDKQVNVYKSILSCLEDTCKDETRKSFYKSPKGKELTTLSEEQEKAEDLLHSDMIGAEVLKLLATICKKNNIGMTIPMDTTKQLTNNG